MEFTQMVYHETILRSINKIRIKQSLIITHLIGGERIFIPYIQGRSYMDGEHDNSLKENRIGFKVCTQAKLGDGLYRSTPYSTSAHKNLNLI